MRKTPPESSTQLFPKQLPVTVPGFFSTQFQANGILFCTHSLTQCFGIIGDKVRLNLAYRTLETGRFSPSWIMQESFRSMRSLCSGEVAMLSGVSARFLTKVAPTASALLATKAVSNLDEEQSQRKQIMQAYYLLTFNVVFSPVTTFFSILQLDKMRQGRSALSYRRIIQQRFSFSVPNAEYFGRQLRGTVVSEAPRATMSFWVFSQLFDGVKSEPDASLFEIVQSVCFPALTVVAVGTATSTYGEALRLFAKAQSDGVIGSGVKLPKTIPFASCTFLALAWKNLFADTTMFTGIEAKKAYER